MFLYRRRLPFLSVLAQGGDEEIMNTHRIIRLLLAAALLAAATAQAAMPPMPEVPLSLPDAVRDPLIAKRKSLAEKKLALIDEANANNRQCANVVQDSPQHLSCLAKLQEFNAKVEVLRTEFNQLEDEIDAAVVAEEKRQAAIAAEAKRQADIAAEKMRRVEEEKKRRAAINTDASVVDARNVPREGAYLIVQVPELANSPAADRITKGYQAVLHHDWPVALAWWQDALQRDPNNAALKRSVDLAQWMVDPRKVTQSRPPSKLDAAVEAFSKGDDAVALQLIKKAKAENPALTAQADRMIAVIQPLVESQPVAKPGAGTAKHNQTVPTAEGERKSLSDQFLEDGLLFQLSGDDKHAEEMFRQADFFRPFDPKQISPAAPASTKSNLSNGK